MKKSVILLTLFLFLNLLYSYTLNEYVAVVFKNSNEYQSAQLDLTIKKLSYNLAASKFLPNIKFSLKAPNYSWNESYINYFGIPQRISLITERRNLGASFSLEQNLPFSSHLSISHSVDRYKTEYNIYENVEEFDNYTQINFNLPLLQYDSSKLNYIQQKQAYIIAKNSFYKIKKRIKKKAESLYLQALLYIKKEKIAKNDLSISKMIYKLTEEKYKNGLASKLDLMDAKIQITQKKLNLLQINNSKKEILEQMKSFAKLKSITIDDKDITLYNNQLIPLDEALKKVLSSDPDLLNLKTQYDTLKYQSKFDKYRQYFNASINLGYSLDGRGDTLSESFKNYKKYGWYGYFTIDIPIFDFNYEKNTYQKELLTLKKLKINIEDSRSNLIEQIKKLYRTNNDYKKTLELLKLQVEQNKKRFEMSKLRYKNGLDDLQTLERNQLNYLNALYNLENNIYMLNQNYLEISYYVE